MTTSKRKKMASSNSQLSTPTWRYYVVLGIVVLIYLGLFARTAYIQVVEPDMLKKQGDKRSLRAMKNTVQRGTILDRNGEKLAISVPVETVWVDPKTIMQKNALGMKRHWQALANVLGQDLSQLTEKVAKKPNKRFVYIARQVSPVVGKYIKDLGIPGVYLRKESKRFYPSGEISAHVVGFTNIDDQGIEGVERIYDKLLTGKEGVKRYRKDAKGKKVEIVSVEHSERAKNITLTIDQRIQALAYRELKGAVQAFKATSGSVVVVNAHSGEILALVNSPSYNPNNIKNTAVHRFRNRAITDFYEPGSTMKPLTALSALEFGSVKSNTVINTSPGWMRLGGRRVSDPINRGKLTIEEILIHSSNMGTTKLALSVPKDFLLDRFFDAGFGSKTGTDLIGESSGIMHDRQRWSEFELATLSWGYGLALTPLQLARFYATLANDGVKNELSIIKGIEKYPGERVYSSENTKAVVNMLESVVDEHVPNALVSGYRVGGKTGTSIKAVAGGYGNDYVGLFAGVAPISNPELAVVVVINEPGGDLYEGGEVAAPVFSRVMKGALQVLNINPDKNSMQTSLSQKQAIEEDNDA